MPELPEVESAARVAHAASVGRTVEGVRVLHRSLRRTLPAAAARSLAGETIAGVERRGKHQLLRLASGRMLHVHFRMTGDWRVGRRDDALPATVRLVIAFTDGTILALDDARALAVVSLHPAGIDPCADLGPEATAPDFNAEWMAGQLAGRRAPIKPLLLDQRLVAGIGNIYAAEALWHARIDPRQPAAELDAVALRALTRGVKHVMRKALEQAARYYGASGVSDAVRFNVYDREGRACRRCGGAIGRITQAGRSTYFCPRCQR